MSPAGWYREGRDERNDDGRAVMDEHLGELNSLYAYCTHAGQRGPQDGWGGLTW